MGAFFDFALAQRNACLVHQQFQLKALLFDNAAGLLVTEALEIPTHDLIQRGFAADFIVDDAVARHVHAHIRG